MTLPKLVPTILWTSLTLFVAVLFSPALEIVFNKSECGPTPAGKRMATDVIVASNAYLTEYGVLPGSDLSRDQTKDTWFGDVKAGASEHNNAIFFAFRDIPKGPNENFRMNMRRIIFVEEKAATISKDGTPHGGFFDHRPNAPTPPPDLESCLYDPWGREYGIVIDTNGDGVLDLTGIYSDFTGARAPRKQIGVFSFGKDGAPGTKGDHLYRQGDKLSDDIISWE